MMDDIAVDVIVMDIPYASDFTLVSYDLSECSQDIIDRVFNKMDNGKYSIELQIVYGGNVILEVNEDNKEKLIKIMSKYSELELIALCYDSSAVLHGSRY